MGRALCLFWRVLKNAPAQRYRLDCVCAAYEREGGNASLCCCSVVPLLCCSVVPLLCCAAALVLRCACAALQICVRGLTDF